MNGSKDPGNNALLTFLFLLFCQVFFYDQIVYDEILSFHRVFAHVVFQQFCHLVAFVQGNLLQSDVGSDEMAEFIGTYFTQTFESRDFRVGPKIFYGLDTLFLAVTVLGDEIIGRADVAVVLLVDFLPNRTE